MKVPYDPTPEEIRAACAAIRAGWSENETKRRSDWAVEQQQVTLKEIELGEIAE